MTASPALAGLLGALSVALALAATATLRAVPVAERRLDVRRHGRRGNWLERLAKAVGVWILSRLSGRTRAALAGALDRAGRPVPIELFVGYSALVAVAGLFLALQFASSGSALVALMVALGGAGAPHLWLRKRATERQEEIGRQLPQLLDMLAVSVRGGVAYRRAVSMAGEHLGGALGEELAYTLREIGLGASVRDAFEALSERNPLPALDSFVAAQLRAEELGVPLADALHEIAQDVRRTAWQAARTQVERAEPRAVAVTGLLGGVATLVAMIAAIIASVSDELGSFF